MSSAVYYKIKFSNTRRHTQVSTGVESTYVKTSEDRQVEGQQLQRDDAQDALQTVHTVRHLNVAAGALDGLVIIFVADHNRAAL